MDDHGGYGNRSFPSTTGEEHDRYPGAAEGDRRNRGESDGHAHQGTPDTADQPEVPQADIQTILRSLARIVGKNVLVKSEIKGEIRYD